MPKGVEVGPLVEFILPNVDAGLPKGVETGAVDSLPNEVKVGAVVVQLPKGEVAGTEPPKVGTEVSPKDAAGVAVPLIKVVGS